MIFLIEQMELAFMQNMHRRYSPDLLSTCVLWENTSCDLYKKIREEGLLTIHPNAIFRSPLQCSQLPLV